MTDIKRSTQIAVVGEATTAVTSYLMADHYRLDLLFSEFTRLRPIELSLAEKYFQDFAQGLRRHISWEEDVLFVFFEQRAEVKNQKLITLMREEHGLIKGIIKILEDNKDGLSANCEKEIRRLGDILSHHNLREERFFYPALSQMMPPKEEARLFLAMEEIPQERFQNCCRSH